MPRPPESLIDTALRRRFIIEKVQAGLSRRQIVEAAEEKFGADQLPNGWGPRYVAKDLKRMIGKLRDDISERAQEYKTVQISRCEEMLSELWPLTKTREVTRYTDDGEAYTATVPPSMKAVDRVLKIMERLDLYLRVEEARLSEGSAQPQGNVFFTQINNDIRAGQ